MPNPFNTDKPKGQRPEPAERDRKGRPARDDMGADVGGVFDCQVCDEKVVGATLNPKNGMLTWVCSKNHRSHIKDFA